MAKIEATIAEPTAPELKGFDDQLFRVRLTASFSMRPESEWLMLQNTPCERCQRIGFVHLERIFNGNTLTLSYYCGECDHSWQTVTADQRQFAPGRILDKWISYVVRFDFISVRGAENET
jgi:hypothetical protein